MLLAMTRRAAAPPPVEEKPAVTPVIRVEQITPSARAQYVGGVVITFGAVATRGVPAPSLEVKLVNADTGAVMDSFTVEKAELNREYTETHQITAVGVWHVYVEAKASNPVDTATARSDTVEIVIEPPAVGLRASISAVSGYPARLTAKGRIVSAETNVRITRLTVSIIAVAGGQPAGVLAYRSWDNPSMDTDYTVTYDDYEVGVNKQAVCQVEAVDELGGTHREGSDLATYYVGEAPAVTPVISVSGI